MVVIELNSINFVQIYWGLFLIALDRDHGQRLIFSCWFHNWFVFDASFFFLKQITAIFKGLSFNSKFGLVKICSVGYIPILVASIIKAYNKFMYLFTKFKDSKVIQTIIVTRYEFRQLENSMCWWDLRDFDEDHDDCCF